MEKKGKPALTRQAWLHELGRRLAWSFSGDQVRDILSDYQEQFDAGNAHGKPEAEIIQALGTPAEAAALLLEEDPAARTSRLRQNVLWGAALAVCFAFLWLCLHTVSFGLFWIGTSLFIPLAASVLFMLLRGPCRVVLDQQHISRTLPYYLPAGLALVGLLEKLLLPQYSMYLYRQYSASQISDEAFQQASRVLRYGNALFWLMLMAVTALLAVWLLVRSAAGSIQYLPGLIHTVGALGTTFFTYAHFHSTVVYPDSFHASMLLLLPCCLPYVSGLVTALVYQRWVDGRKPLPRFFQGGETAWQDWRHRLGVCLLGWFSVEQTLEIMEDYQEQYELGLEQGKAEKNLLSEMGHPETVVRDLLAEDRKARLNRRKNWLWAAMAAMAGWLLLDLMRAFEIGYYTFLWRHSDTCMSGIAALLLGTPSLFILFHSRERAAVERRFPALRAHLVRICLPPLVLSALVEGLSFWLIYRAFYSHDIPFFFNLPLTSYLIVLIEFSVLLLTLLLIWTLARCSSGSILHFPAIPSIAGGIAAVLCAGIYLSSMDTSYMGNNLTECFRNFLPSVYPYLSGVLLTVISRLVLRATGKKEG